MTKKKIERLNGFDDAFSMTILEKVNELVDSHNESVEKEETSEERRNRIYGESLKKSKLITPEKKCCDISSPWIKTEVAMYMLKDLAFLRALQSDCPCHQGESKKSERNDVY